MEPLFESNGFQLAGHLARPRSAPGTWTPGLVLCHGFPSGPDGGRNSARSYPELADRIATEMGWTVLCFNFRGCGLSEGGFSLWNWLRDSLAAAAWLRDLDDVLAVWMAGFGTGGAMATCAAAQDPGIMGVAAVGAPADFDDWASHPRRLLQHANEVGIMGPGREPVVFDAWARELREIRAVACAPHVGNRPMLVLHGSDDEAVPVFDARVLADAHGTAELRVIDGGAHQLRHDPRAVATLLGWLDRQRNQAGSKRAPTGEGSR